MANQATSRTLGWLQTEGGQLSKKVDSASVFNHLSLEAALQWEQWTPQLQPFSSSSKDEIQ